MDVVNPPRFEHPYEMSGANLKYKYRVRKAVSGHPSRTSNQGTPIHGTPPVGLPRVYRGKTHYR